jgi:sensor c-di-GMP phosphodiesterase-like protein
MHSEAAERQLLENDLRQAIERGELAVHYQPIVRTAGEEISGFEAWSAGPTRRAEPFLRTSSSRWPRKRA